MTRRTRIVEAVKTIISPIIGFLAALTTVYFLVEYVSFIGIPNILVASHTLTSYHAINGLEIRTLYLLEEILFTPDVAHSQNILLYYLSWGIGGLTAGVIGGRSRFRLIFGILVVTVGVFFYWIYVWILLQGSNIVLLFNQESITRLIFSLSGTLGALTITTITGFLGNILVQKKKRQAF
ncbi:MAG: hypothetical protein ACTSW4_04780 [Candidatus Ranarchaeia archaeon]